MTISTRPRVVVAVTATADGRVTLSRGERLLDPGAGARWESVWPADVADLLARRAALTRDPSLVAARQALDPAGQVDETALATLLRRVHHETAHRH